MSGAVSAGPLGIGSTATAEMIAGWDIDIRPDGTGLARGPWAQSQMVRGSTKRNVQAVMGCLVKAKVGGRCWQVVRERLIRFTQRRPSGPTGPMPRRFGTISTAQCRTPAPQSLTDDEVYAISAYVLYLNDIVDEDFVATKESFAQVKMPNEPNFFIDNRPDVQNIRCMNNCADPSQFEIVTTINGVTPTGHFKEDSGVAANHYGREQPKASAVEVVMSDAAVSGKAVYDKACQACHNMGVAGAPKVGDAGAWVDRIATGVESMNRNAINGYQGPNGVMPAKGGNMSLSNDEVKNAVAYMVDSSR